MPWTKSGDNAATYPLLLAVDTVRTAEDWSTNEVTGFVSRLFWHSAAHMTDYRVTFGDCKQFGSGRHELLIAQAVAVGLLTWVEGEGRARVWKLIEDPEFMHIRRKAEVQFDRQRDADRRNKDLTMPVRLRDGDGCRYCGQVVSWVDHKTGRAGTYDHRNPGDAATIETYVVACRSCNSGRKAEDDADARYPLLPVPQIPVFAPKTREILEAFYGPEQVAARLGEPTPAAQQPAGERDNPRSDSQSEHAITEISEPVPPAAADPPEPVAGPGSSSDPNQIQIRSSLELEKTRRGSRLLRVDAGSGRVGPGLGLEGTGRAGPVRDQVGSGREPRTAPGQTQPSPSRSRRSRRSRGR